MYTLHDAITMENGWVLKFSKKMADIWKGQPNMVDIWKGQLNMADICKSHPKMADNWKSQQKTADNWKSLQRIVNKRKSQPKTADSCKSQPKLTDIWKMWIMHMSALYFWRYNPRNDICKETTAEKKFNHHKSADYAMSLGKIFKDKGHKMAANAKVSRKWLLFAKDSQKRLTLQMSAY